ncbi:hypothetical protein [Janibacter terrae]|uniref:hypothetical protein n=1 Tax=Janibacter terrae TaxID=103817 RepID=UPI0031F7995B
MPNRIYRGSHPPSVLDHMLAHPWELLIALLSVALGASSLAATVAGSRTSPSVDRLPDPLVVALAIMLIVGGAWTARGLFDNSTDLMVGYAHERFGLVLIGTAWSIYAVTVFVAFPGSVNSWALGAALGIGSALRLAATERELRKMRGHT